MQKLIRRDWDITMMIILRKLPVPETISLHCCEYQMKKCDETISDFEISNGNRASIHIYQVQRESEN